MELTPLKYFESLYPPNTREKEIREYLNILKKGLSAQLIGLPGTGRNNLLRLLAYNISARTYHLKNYEKLVHFVYIDSTEAKNRSTFDINKLILASLHFSLSERRMTTEANEIKTLLQEGLAFNDEALFFQYLKRATDYLTVEKKLTLILLMDRFDALAPTLTEDFFSNLMSIRNNAKYRFGVVFSLKRPLEDTVDLKILSDFNDLISGNEIYISINDPIGVNFRLNYIQKAARNKVDPKTRGEIITLCGGHAKLTKLSFENVVSHEGKIENLKEYLLSIDSIKKALKEIWECLMPGEKDALKSNMSHEEIKTTHPYLIKTGLLTPNGISIPLFDDYIKDFKEENNDPLVYNEETNEILKGNTSLTNVLSSSEVRLLKFLIQNKEKVLTKDEIINTVWSDQKTQEGVTDQALDQIFYRLRKKIEIDPSNPQFIHTIKGTGYKFTS